MINAHKLERKCYLITHPDLTNLWLVTLISIHPKELIILPEIDIQVIAL